MRLALLSALALGACYAAPPLPVDPSSLPPCSAGTYGVLGTDRCETDADCATCTSDVGTSRAVARARLAELGDACVARATADTACCEHRCTIVSSGGYF